MYNCPSPDGHSEKDNCNTLSFTIWKTGHYILCSVYSDVSSMVVLKRAHPTSQPAMFQEEWEGRPRRSQASGKTRLHSSGFLSLSMSTRSSALSQRRQTISPKNLLPEKYVSRQRIYSLGDEQGKALTNAEWASYWMVKVRTQFTSCSALTEIQRFQSL